MKVESNQLRFYVYAYLRKSDNSPYYIGKGHGYRAFNRNHSVTVPKDRTKIVFLERNLTNLGALAIERRMIQWYGRKDINTGILRNRSDGGEGATGAVQSEESRRRRGDANRGRKLPPRTKEHSIKIGLGNRGKIRSDAVKQHLSELNKGKPSHRKGKTNPGASLALKGKVKPKFSCPHCEKMLAINVLKQWHLDKCKEKK